MRVCVGRGLGGWACPTLAGLRGDCSGARYTPLARLLVAVYAAFFAFRSGAGSSRRDLLRARVCALFRRAREPRRSVLRAPGGRATSRRASVPATAMSHSLGFSLSVDWALTSH